MIQQRSGLEANIETAIRFIQKIERGRQGIVRVLKAIYIKKKEQRKNEKKKEVKQVTDYDMDDAEEQKKEQVTSLQKTIRAYLARKKVEVEKNKELEFLGMIKKKPNPKDPTSKFYRANKVREKFRELQREQEKAYKNELVDLKEKLLEDWEEPLKEKMLRDRRMWITEFM